jgi:hypothetical protein
MDILGKSVKDFTGPTRREEMSKSAGTRTFWEASLAKTLAMVGDAVKVAIDCCIIDANL